MVINGPLNIRLIPNRKLLSLRAGVSLDVGDGWLAIVEGFLDDVDEDPEVGPYEIISIRDYLSSDELEQAIWLAGRSANRLVLNVRLGHRSDEDESADHIHRAVSLVHHVGNANACSSVICENCGEAKDSEDGTKCHRCRMET